MPSDVPTAETTAETAPEPSAVAVIPARGGSKRIPHKNVRLLNGKPLLAYTVAAALGSGVFARVIVSTDDEAVADAAAAAGATVLARAADLADDHTPASSVTAQVAEALGLPDAQPDAQLLPNCPLRTAADVRASRCTCTSVARQACTAVRSRCSAIASTLPIAIAARISRRPERDPAATSSTTESSASSTLSISYTAAR